MKSGFYQSLSVGVVFGLVILLVGLALGGMFLSDDAEDWFGRAGPRIAQPMELQGRWLGMRLTSLNTPTAARMGVPPSAKGVMVVELEERNGWRASQAEVLSGDVITAVEQKKVRDLSDLYDVSRKLDVGSALVLDVRRWGQPIRLVLPAVYPASVATSPVQANTGVQAQVQTVPGAGGGAIQAAGLGAQFGGCRFYCPQHNQMWSTDAVLPNYRCPIGGCPLRQVPIDGGTQAAGTVAQFGGTRFFCPQHNRIWSGEAVLPNYRCPMGGCPLSQVQ